MNGPGLFCGLRSSRLCILVQTRRCGKQHIG
ncbi:MAG: hypothetical protein K0S85_2620, partial [Pseudomonas orientalis]|nr:hypothetical protein [Pseudomonas orientalis]